MQLLLAVVFLANTVSEAVLLGHAVAGDAAIRTRPLLLQRGLKPELMGMIDKFRAEKCAHLYEKHEKEFASYKRCLKFMMKACSPGSDMRMDGDSGEISSGEGFCEKFFSTERDDKEGLNKKIEEERQKAAEEGSQGPIPGIPIPGPNGGSNGGSGGGGGGGGGSGGGGGGGNGGSGGIGIDGLPIDGGIGGGGGRGGDGGDGRDGMGGIPGLTGIDTDGDGIFDHVDLDDDNDGTPDVDDSHPLDASEWEDMDGDGIGDNSDKDIDGDGFFNEEDLFPRDRSEHRDHDGDGIPDNQDPDDDNDGWADEVDSFPRDNKRFKEEKPAKRKASSRFHMSEAEGLPAQGFNGPLVEHNDMETYISDWMTEYGNHHESHESPMPHHTLVHHSRHHRPRRHHRHWRQ